MILHLIEMKTQINKQWSGLVSEERNESRKRWVPYTIYINMWNIIIQSLVFRQNMKNTIIYDEQFENENMIYFNQNDLLKNFYKIFVLFVGMPKGRKDFEKMTHVSEVWYIRPIIKYTDIWLL